MQKTMIVGLAALMLAQAVPAADAPASRRVQCWTDEHGQRACGDRVPPQFAKQERQVFDQQGRIVQTKPREKTPDEVAAEEEARRSAERLRRDEQKAREYDRFLLSTFETVRDLERARDERLQILDGRGRLLEKAITDNDKALAQQRARIASIKKNGKTPAPAVTQRLAELERAAVDNRKALDVVKNEQQDTRSKYAADIERYETLRAARR